jgi:hypothetical protein
LRIPTGLGHGAGVGETPAFERVHKEKLLILSFNPVRLKKAPIGGMQNPLPAVMRL